MSARQRGETAYQYTHVHAPSRRATVTSRPFWRPGCPSFAPLGSPWLPLGPWFAPPWPPCASLRLLALLWLLALPASPALSPWWWGFLSVINDLSFFFSFFPFGSGFQLIDLSYQLQGGNFMLFACSFFNFVFLHGGAARGGAGLGILNRTSLEG